VRHHGKQIDSTFYSKSFRWIHREPTLSRAGHLLLLPLLLIALVTPACSAPKVTKSVNAGAYFYRMKASYSYGDEPIKFDVVVGCSVRVTGYRGGESAFGASRYPRFFIHRTRDNHEVMQILPLVCRGQTTENGRIPKDFLPGAIWFEKAGDYRLGIAYVSEDEFESPNGKLKFHGASVHRATLAEWEAFRKRAAGNEGMRRLYYTGPPYSTEDARRIASLGGKEIERAYARVCRGVRRYRLSEAGRALVRKFWPAHQPSFWSNKRGEKWPWQELQRLEKTTPVFANGVLYARHFIGSSYKYAGFPTRARGGMLDSNAFKFVAPEFFPLQFDRGIPWVFTERVAKSAYLTKDVEVHSGVGKGFLYCYTLLNPGKGKLEIPIPDYRSRELRIRVDGKPVVAPKSVHQSWPSPFFEQDEYIYFITGVSLS